MLQVVLHADTSHTYGAHETRLTAQVPAPSQTAPLTAPLAQVVAPHAMPAFAKLRQARLPSQLPSALQESG